MNKRKTVIQSMNSGIIKEKGKPVRQQVSGLCRLYYMQRGLLPEQTGGE